MSDEEENKGPGPSSTTSPAVLLTAEAVFLIDDAETAVRAMVERGWVVTTRQTSVVNFDPPSPPQSTEGDQQ